MAKFGAGRGSGERLKRYWVYGKGRERWVHSPHPWRALHRELARYIHDPEKLDRTTSEWHNLIMLPTGSDLYRVRHGGKFRGKRIGRG
jgi:hypothetical protein